MCVWSKTIKERPKKQVLVLRGNLREHQREAANIFKRGSDAF